MADLYPPAGVYPVGTCPDALQYNAPKVGVFLADAIDPETGDYRSIARGVDPVEAAVLEALLVRRGTGSAVRDDGIRLDDLQLIDDAFEGVLRSEVTYALRRLIEAEQIEITGLVITTENDAATVEIRFRNLTRDPGNQARTVQLPLLALLGRLQ